VLTGQGTEQDGRGGKAATTSNRHRERCLRSLAVV
jgi:hypothetical protein